MNPVSISNESLQVLFCAGTLVVSPVEPQSGPSAVRAELEGMGGAEPELQSCSDPLRGSGRRMFLRAGSRTVTATLHAGSPFLHLETHVENPGAEAVTLDVLHIAQLGFEAARADEVASWRTLGSGGMKPVERAENSFAYFAVADPASRSGAVCAWLTQERGLGTFSPVARNNTFAADAWLEFGNLRIAPGKSRETDTLVIGFFRDVRLGLEAYAGEIAKTQGIRLPPKPAVYCTWYARRHSSDGAGTEDEAARSAAFAREHLQPFGLGVYQIDDHWQAGSHGNAPVDEDLDKGPIKIFRESNTNFPSGMAALAGKLRAAGFTPGIWFMPFAGESRGASEDFPPEIFAEDPSTGKPLANTRWSGSPIDATSPEGEAFLRDRFRRFREWGYDYVKVDGLHLGAPSHNIYIHRIPSGKSLRPAVLHDPDKTFIEAFRRGLSLLREELPGAFVLGCTSTQNMVSLAPVFGLVDAMRVGPDNDAAGQGDWTQLVYGADYAGNLWFLNNRVWHNDPDPFFVRDANPTDKARWMASWLAVSGAMNTTSERYAELPPERLDLIKRTLPAHDLPARPVDILDREKPAVWIVGNGRQHVVGLFNWDKTKPAKITESIARLGLDPSKDYEVFDYWENRHAGCVRGSIDAALPGAGCRVLALREAAGHPQIVSTSRHITQGLVDLEAESWDPATRTLRGTSRLVADDPCELRIVCPDDLVAQESPGVTLSTEGRLVRATIHPDRTGPVEWAITFRPKQETAAR